MSEEIIDGKREVLRVTIPADQHPTLVAMKNRAAKLARYPNQFPVVVNSGPQLLQTNTWIMEPVK